jgi:inorganic pyrophosphatase
MLPKTLLSAPILVSLLAAFANATPSKPPQKFDLKDLKLREVGARDTLVCWTTPVRKSDHTLIMWKDWRVWLERNGDPISFWHDVPLYPDPNNHRIVHFVVEIPRWTNGKIEISRDEPLSMLTKLTL